MEHKHKTFEQVSEEMKAELERHCPKCGADEIGSNTPRTTYECGSSDYDGRPDTFRQSEECRGKREELEAKIE